MSRDSLVTVRVPGPLRSRCRGASELSVRAGTVQGVLDELQRSQPELHGSICDETGAVRRHVGVFVNEDHVRELGGLATPLQDGDAVWIFTAVSGG